MTSFLFFPGQKHNNSIIGMLRGSRRLGQRALIFTNQKNTFSLSLGLESHAGNLESHAGQSTERASSGSSASTSGSALDPLYPTHIRLNLLQRGMVAVFSAFGAALDPRRADLVAALGETTGVSSLQRMRERMLQSASGRRILEEKPRITNEILASASDMPPGTFGHAYGQFMGRRHFEADERPPVRFIDDVELAYVAQRARETHDLWHVLFGCPTTVTGELALKAVEFVQTGLPMAALSVVGGQWRLKSEDRQRLMTVLVPWALQAGSRCADLMCLRYEDHFKDNLLDLRRQWRITTAPTASRNMSTANFPSAVTV